MTQLSLNRQLVLSVALLIVTLMVFELTNLDIVVQDLFSTSKHNNGF